MTSLKSFFVLLILLVSTTSFTHSQAIYKKWMRKNQKHLKKHFVLYSHSKKGKPAGYTFVLKSPVTVREYATFLEYCRDTLSADNADEVLPDSSVWRHIGFSFPDGNPVFDLENYGELPMMGISQEAAQIYLRWFKQMSLYAELSLLLGQCKYKRHQYFYYASEYPRFWLWYSAPTPKELKFARTIDSKSRHKKALFPKANTQMGEWLSDGTISTVKGAPGNHGHFRMVLTVDGRGFREVRALRAPILQEFPSKFVHTSLPFPY